jgi:hypothetical protein
VDRGALRDRDLGDDVCRRPEPVDAQPAARRQLRPAQRAVPDNARTEQRRGRDVVQRFGQPVSAGLRDDRILRVAAVGVPSGEYRVRTQVLPARPASPAILHVPRSHAMPIRSPMAKRAASGASASTTPTTS